jgi:hypothetical protein
MKKLSHYTTEMEQITDQASKETGSGNGVAWLFMIVGVVVTGTMTYALCRKGMTSSMLWSGWVSVAAFFPVVLMEGSALALTYGKQHWFRSTQQRELADVASWIIWVVLAATSVVHFAFGSSADSSISSLLGIYASYVLPLAIVAVPMLWKRLYDTAPDSMIKVAVLEAEAELRSGLVEVQREQNGLMISAYREALNTPRVAEARKAVFERASIEHARNIAGFIEGADQTEQSPALLAPPSSRPNPPEPRWNRAGLLLNPEDFTDEELEQLGITTGKNGHRPN